MNKDIKVLFIAAEASNLIKVGGLGDVAGELPSKLQEMGIDMNVVIPAYKDIDASTSYLTDFPVPMGLRTETCIVREACDMPVKTYLIDNYHYFGRAGVYGYQDDSERFAFLCLSVCHMLKFLNFRPDIIHMNDWHTAPLAMLIRENERKLPDFAGISLVYTIHNMEYQGMSGKDIFNMYGVREAIFENGSVESFGCFNPMKAGLNYSDRINTVSKTYAEEIKTEKCGFGLDGAVRDNKARLKGIINGIDTNVWNPATDPLIHHNYSIESIELKRENKHRLQDELGLNKSDAPLFGCIMRLVPNKGVDFLEAAAEAIVKDGGQLVLLGRGEKLYEHSIRRLAERYSGRVAVRLEFNQALSRRIYAGADIYLMPSRYEPCGIGQMIAMSYGAVPVVHKTGGLADTVVDLAKAKEEGTGFVFGTYSQEAFIRAIRRSVKMFRTDKEGWNALIKRDMRHDSSWEGPVLEYISLYNEAVKENCMRKIKGGKSKLEKQGTNNENPSYS